VCNASPVKVAAEPASKTIKLLKSQMRAHVKSFLALLNQGMKTISLKSRSFVDTGFYDWHI
jgi:hypothetical protein